LGGSPTSTKSPYLNKSIQLKADKKIERKMPIKIKQLKQMELKQVIAEIIMNPNKTWKKLKRKKYMAEKSYFQNN
jgi:hypothetical protein